MKYKCDTVCNYISQHGAKLSFSPMAATHFSKSEFNFTRQVKRWTRGKTKDLTEIRQKPILKLGQCNFVVQILNNLLVNSRGNIHVTP